MDFMNPMYDGCHRPDGGSGGPTVGGTCGCEDRKPSCGRNGWALQDYPLAIVYSPYQTFEGLYDMEKALKRGTLFHGLDLPFEGQGNGSCNKGKGCCK